MQVIDLVQRHDVIYMCICHRLDGAFNWGFRTHQKYFPNENDPFNPGKGYNTALTKSNIFVLTNAYIWHHDVATNRSNVIPALLPCSAKIMFILPDLCTVGKPRNFTKLC